MHILNKVCSIVFCGHSTHLELECGTQPTGSGMLGWVGANNRSCKCVPGTRRWRNHIHSVSLFEIVQTDDVIVQWTQFDAAHKRSKTQRRWKLVNETNTSSFRKEIINKIRVYLNGGILVMLPWYVLGHLQQRTLCCWGRGQTVSQSLELHLSGWTSAHLWSSD